jgi:anti-anti-sigma factor
MPGSLLRVATQGNDDTVVIHCAGELDTRVVDGLHRAIDRACTAELSFLRIDAVDVTFIDSTGLACLLEAKRRCEELGATLEIVPSRPVAQLFDLTAAPIRRGRPQRQTFLRMPRPKREGG